MAANSDPYRLSSPQVFLVRMAVFLALTALIALIIYEPIIRAFSANPFLNGLILFVLLFGIAYTFRQVFRLFREIAWVNRLRIADPGIEAPDSTNLLAPMAVVLKDRKGRLSMTTDVMRSILDSIATRLDESRETSRYLVGLLVFLGLLGTFWGLLETVGSVADTIQRLSITAGDNNTIFTDLQRGLQAPLAGMGTAFSSSLFGLAGSLVLGFMDLQAGQAQNRFYTEFEDWLSTVVDVPSIEVKTTAAPVPQGAVMDDKVLAKLEENFSQISKALNDGGPTRAATAAMADLAEGVQGLVQHMRQDQKNLSEWMKESAMRQRELNELMRMMVERDK